MGFYNKMCMLSNTPIAEGSKVKLFFLVAEGKYGAPIFSDNICYPWDISTILGGLSITARYISHREYEVEDDIKSQYILSVLRENQNNPALTFSDIFESLHDNTPITVYPHKKTGYLRIGLIHFELYNKMVNYHKEKALKAIMPRFEHYIELRDSRDIPKSIIGAQELKRFKEYMMDLHVGGLKEYATDLINEPGRHPFADIKLNHNLNDSETLNVLLDDMIMMNIFFECSILLCQRPLNDVHSSNKLKRELFKNSHETLYNKREVGFFKTQYKVSIHQEISLKDIRKAFEYESYKDERKDIEEFAIKHTGKEKVKLTSNEIKGITFLKDYIEDPDIELTIFF